MIAALALVSEIRARGAELRIADGKLKVRPRSAVRDLEAEILANADAIADAIQPKRPVAVISIADDGEPEPLWPHRIVVDERQPFVEPVELNAWTTVVDPPRAIDALLLDLAVAVRRFGETRADDGDNRRVREASEHGERIEELIENLAKLGARVRVVAVC